MNFGTDTRAQSTLVGAILLFAILIIAFSSYQASVVPNQNAGVEFNHNSEVQTDMQDLRNSLLDVQSVEQLSNGNHTEVSEHRPVAVQLGTQYPARLIALNPPAPSGTIETVEPTTAVRIENATLAESVDEFKKDPNVLLEEDLNTTFLRYSPGYNEYQEPPDTVLEHSLLYNDFGDAKITVRSQTVLRPETNQIHIVLFDGEVSQSGTGSVTLDPETVDGPTTPVPIENDGTLTIQIPTQSPTAWNETIDELDGVGFEKPPDSNDDQIRVTLENGTYDLRVTRVSFDGGEPELSNQLTEIQRVDDGGDGGGNGTLPGPRVTNISTSTTDGSVSPGDSFNLNATISNVGNDSVNRGGTAIQYAEWYLDGSNPPSEGEGTPMNDVKGAYLNDVEVDVGDRISASEDLNPGNNTLVVRANDTRGIWGDETDRITVRLEGPPTVQTDPATSVNTSAATLNGNLADLGTASEVNVYFEYRETGSATWEKTANQTRTTTGTFNERVTGLSSGTEYEFRAVAESADGRNNGSTLTFTTGGAAAPPTFETLTADDSGVSGGSSTVTFTWDVTGSFDQVTLDTEDDTQVTRTDRTGSATLDTSPGSTQISATVEGPGGSETCTAEIGNGGSLNKGDFTCT